MHFQHGGTNCELLLQSQQGGAMRLTKRPSSTPCCVLCRVLYTQHASSDCSKLRNIVYFPLNPSYYMWWGEMPHQPSDSVFQVYCIVQVRDVQSSWVSSSTMTRQKTNVVLITCSLTREIGALRTKPKQPMTQQDKHLPPAQHTRAGFPQHPVLYMLLSLHLQRWNVPLMNHQGEV